MPAKLKIDDCSSDEDELLNTDNRPTTAKRPRIDVNRSLKTQNELQIGDFPSPNTNWLSPVTVGLANWVGKTRNSFQESYFYKKFKGKLSSSNDQVNDIADSSVCHSKMDVSFTTKRQPVFSPFTKSSTRTKLPKKKLNEKCPKETILLSPIPLTTNNANGNVQASELNASTNRTRKPLSLHKKTHEVHTHPTIELPRNRRSHISVNEKLFNGSSSNVALQNSTVYDSIRLQERDRYRLMLQQFTGVELDSPVANIPREDEIQVLSSQRRPAIHKQKMDDDFCSDLKERLQLKTPSKRYKHNLDGRPSFCSSSLHSSSTSEVVTITDEILWSMNSRPEVEVIQVVRRDAERRTVPKEVVVRIPTAAGTIARRSELTSWLRGQRTSLRKPPVETIVDNGDDDDDEIVQIPVDDIEPIKTRETSSPLLNKLNSCRYLQDAWFSSLATKYTSNDETKQKQVSQYEEKIKHWERSQASGLENRLGESLRFEDVLVVEDEEEDKIEELPTLTNDMLERVDRALVPTPPNEILSEGFNLIIRRKDMETLANVNWLNDEVINFYFNMLMDRGKLDNFPSVYVCNTFFYTKLKSGGHVALKRWTRKTDIFSYDLMLIPVHLGVHWCLAVVDFHEKKVTYYDSMGNSNNGCLQALLDYLKAEHKDKKGTELDTSDWTRQNVKDNPHQLNGSDCGMFTCKYAEYISRNAKITFTQADMPYFRKRMVYEILTKKLL